MLTSAMPSATIAAPVNHGRRPDARPNAHPSRKSMVTAIRLETRSAGPALCMKTNGSATGKKNVVRNTRRRHAEGAPPVVAVKLRALGRLGQSPHPLLDRRQLRGLEDGAREHRHCRRQDLASLLRVAGVADCAEQRETAGALGEASHQVQHPVDDAPCDIAAERTDEHRAHIVATGFRDAE